MAPSLILTKQSDRRCALRELDLFSQNKADAALTICGPSVIAGSSLGS